MALGTPSKPFIWATRPAKPPGAVAWEVTGGAGGIIFGVAMIAAGLVGVQVSFMTVALVVAAIYFLGILVLLRLEETQQV